VAVVEQPSLTVFKGGQVAAGEGDTSRTVVWLHGEHDVSTVGELEAALASAVSIDHVGFTIDLSDVRFIDVVTIGAIERTRDALRAQSRSLELRSPSPFIRRLLELTGLGTLVSPGSLAASPTSGAASALGSWVSVPATARVDSVDDVAASSMAVGQST
jgi:anti-sigma B factor antagonist